VSVGSGGVEQRRSSASTGADRSFPQASEAASGARHNRAMNNGSSCAECRRGDSDRERACKRALSQGRLPVEVRQQLLEAIYDDQPFRTVLLDLSLTSNQVLGAHQDRPRQVREARGRPDRNPPGRPQAPHVGDVFQGLRVLRMSRVAASADGKIRG